MSSAKTRDDALHTVHQRNEFYRDGYQRMLRCLPPVVVALVASIAANVYLAVDRPTPEYFATTTTGEIIPLTPLSQPMVTDEHVVNWAARAAAAAYTYNFANWREQWQRRATEYFTREGWADFQSAMDKVGTLNAVIQSKLNVTGLVRGAPVIVEKGGVIDGLARRGFSWKVQMPMQVTYESASQRWEERLIVTLVVSRRSTLDHPSGIGIDQFIARKG